MYTAYACSSLSIPGVIIGYALMKSISLLNLKHSANVYCAVLAVFILLVYPYILKRYLAKSG